MNSTLSLVKPRKQITHGVKKKKKSKDEILKEEERKLTYAQKRKQKAYGSQEEPNPFTLHASARFKSPYPTFQAPSIRVIDLRNKHMRSNRRLITMPGISREVQLIDETDVIKNRLKEQTTNGKGTPWYERKDRASYGNGGTRQIPPHVTRIKIPRGAVDRKLIEKHAYQGSQYSFNPNTTVYVKRFVDCKVGTPVVRERKKLNRKEMYFGDMQKCFSHYYRSGSLYVRNTDKKLDGDRMLKLRVLERRRLNAQLKEEKLLKRKLKKKEKRAKLRQRPKSSKRRSKRNKSKNIIEMEGARPMTR